jgi:hypothetical protein
MRDEPFVVQLAQTNRRAHRRIRFLTVGSCPLNVIEAVTEGHFIARSDLQLVDFVTHRVFERSEPLRPVSSTGICALVLQRWRKIEQEDVGGVIGDDSIEIFGAHCLCPIIQARANPGFVSLRLHVYLLSGGISNQRTLRETPLLFWLSRFGPCLPAHNLFLLLSPDDERESSFKTAILTFGHIYRFAHRICAASSID